jgi:septal ring factor EnvC (AmiA/AmiB activator)
MANEWMVKEAMEEEDADMDNITGEISEIGAKRSYKSPSQAEQHDRVQELQSALSQVKRRVDDLERDTKVNSKDIKALQRTIASVFW